MRVDLDAKVRTRDGEEAGSVERVVVDPRTNDVTDFVVDVDKEPLDRGARNHAE